MENRNSLVVLLALTCIACSSPSKGTTYFEREIEPILLSSCSSSVSGCHLNDGNGMAQGNLDLSTFKDVQRRKDVLQRYGAFPEPMLLMKAVASTDLVVSYKDEFFPLEIAHGGGAILRPGGDAYLTLKQWLDNGATENGLPPVNRGATNKGDCITALPAGLDPAQVDGTVSAFQQFDAAQDILVQRCAGNACHGSVKADYQLTCGSSDDQKRANFLMTQAFIATNVDDSPILEKGLNPSQGGSFHSGGNFFESRTDDEYQVIRSWAENAGPLEQSEQSVARQFFDSKVMPILLQRGCAAQACHSPIVPFKLNLRPGSLGFISPFSLDINYKEAKKFLGVGSSLPTAGRLIAKNVVSSKHGITHRAGPVLETPGAFDEPASCVAPYDSESASALCTIVRWHRLERDNLPPEHHSDLSEGARIPLAYIQRPPDAMRFVDFSQFRPGANLLLGSVLLGSDADIQSASPGLSLLDSCPGVPANRAQVDVRGPESSYDGTRIIFSMRIGESDGLNLYEVGVDGTGCQKLTADGGTMRNGIKIEYFDPFYFDDHGEEWIVYASTIGGDDGPVRTPKTFLPGTDIWRRPRSGGVPERMTFLRGVEAQPYAMNNGMTSMIVEKSSAEYYQIGARRINWDLSDYHPLLGQRSQSFQGRGGYIPGQEPADAVMLASIGYSQVTEVRQALNGNFLVILADAGSYGKGGALGIFNRSLGPFEMGRDDPGFVKSLNIVPDAIGRMGESSGAYRSPYPLPDNRIMASFVASVDIGQTQAQRFELVIVDPRDGVRESLLTSSDSIVEAILVMPRPPPKPFTRPSNNADIPLSEAYATLHYTDLPLLATIQGSNDRRGRLIEDLRRAKTVRYFTQETPPSSCTSSAHPDCSDKLSGSEQVYESRVDIGSAPLASDGSVYIRVPTKVPLFLELLDESGTPIFRMEEETQFGANENINLAVPERAYSTLCAVCHGSISGRDLDIVVDVDVITTASQTAAHAAGIQDLR